MTGPRRSSGRSSLVLDTHDLARRAGEMRTVRTTVEAPPDLGIAVIGVPVGSPLVLDLQLEAVVEGVLITGTVVAQVAGECVRCLTDLTDQVQVDVQELFSYEPAGPPAEDETPEDFSHLDHELADLEPVLRDAIVLELPFQPVCRPDCRGLCPECGLDLNTVDDHDHADGVDPRWAGLAQFGSDGSSS